MMNIQSQVEQIAEVIAQMEATPQRMSQEELQAECRRLKNLEIQKLKRMQIPRRFWRASFLSGDRRPALERAQRFLNTEAPQGLCLILAGGIGVGKTTAAV